MEDTNEKILIEAGLSEEQAAIYSALLDKGPMKAGPISSWTGIKRGLVYKVLDQLENLGLVSKKGGEGTVAVFSPSHPSRLREIMEQKEKAMALAKETVLFSLGQLSSKFNLQTGKPNVQFFEGLDGVKEIYHQINIIKDDILLIQSPFDADIPEIDEIIQKQIKKQISLNIHTKAITPKIKTTEQWVKEKDKDNLVTRRIIPEGMMDIPAQIIIYSNKIGISSVKKPFISTIIEDEAISKTFKMIFDYIWNISENKHTEIIKSFGSQENS